MKVESIFTTTVYLQLSKEEAELLKALVQNPPVNASAEDKAFMEDLFNAIGEELKK